MDRTTITSDSIVSVLNSLPVTTPGEKATKKVEMFCDIRKHLSIFDPADIDYKCLCVAHCKVVSKRGA